MAHLQNEAMVPAWTARSSTTFVAVPFAHGRGRNPGTRRHCSCQATKRGPSFDRL